MKENQTSRLAISIIFFLSITEDSMRVTLYTRAANTLQISNMNELKQFELFLKPML